MRGAFGLSLDVALRRTLPMVALVVALGGCSTFKDDAVNDGGALEAASTDGAMGFDSPATDATADAGKDISAGDDSSSAQDSSSVDTGTITTDAGSGCEGGTCPVESVVDGLKQATILLVDANNVYISDLGTVTGNVYQCAKGGCAMPATLGPGFATGIGVDGTNVYWSDFAGGQIVACAIGGCANEPTAIAPGQVHAEGLTFDGVNLYWAASGSLVACVPPACSTRNAFATGQSAAIVDVAAETGVAYWTNGPSLESCPVSGCGTTPTPVSPTTGTSIALYGGFIYFINDNAVVSCPTGGSCVSPHTIGSSTDPSGLGTDCVDVYWLDDDEEVVYRCPVTGCSGGPEHFADHQLTAPGANIAVDGEYAYWAVPEQVLRKHK